jgi:RNA polymerase sigma-70 factor (ECF subfamily)
MPLPPPSFHARYGGLLTDAESSALGLDRETFTRALWRSVEKSGARSDTGEASVETYVRGLRLPDLALAAACAAGSEKAWETLLRTMRAPLRAAGRAMAGDRGEELADILFGELYAARERKLGSFAGRSSLAGWLRAVLHQTWIDRLRSEKRLAPMEDDAPEPAAPPAPDAVEQSQNAAIAAGALERALGMLPPRQKLLLDFYYFHNLTLREAAVLVGVHEATASRDLDRARAALKSQLTLILRREHGMDEQAAEACLLEWQPAQESAGSNVLLKE